MGCHHCSQQLSLRDQRRHEEAGAEHLSSIIIMEATNRAGNASSARIVATKMPHTDNGMRIKTSCRACGPEEPSLRSSALPS